RGERREQPTRVERVHDDHDDRREEEREDEHRPHRQQPVEQRAPDAIRRGAHDPTSPSTRRLARRTGHDTSHSSAPTTPAESTITRMSITAIAEPSAQFCAVWNCAATICPTMLPFAPPSTVAVM